MKARFFFGGVLFTLLHLVLAIGLLGLSFGIVMAQFDAGTPISNWQSTFVDLADILIVVLLNPGWSLYGLLKPFGVSQALEWVITALNSCLWGFGIMWLYSKRSRLGRGPS